MALIKGFLFGDIIGRGGRETVKKFLSSLPNREEIDIIIANGENASGGLGITPKTALELKEMGIDVITTGNHIWRKREMYNEIHKIPYLVRPANYPPGLPGLGFITVRKRDIDIAIINLEGRTYMNQLIDCPFRVGDTIIKQLSDVMVKIVDFHAEATSEKRALGFYFDSRVSLIAGTHTHIQTADEEVLPGGTGYITDVGMVGPHYSVIGLKKELAVDKFLTSRPNKYEIGDGVQILNAIYFEICAYTGRCLKIERIIRRY
ncbi:MAG: TIGR00282 family metallophosphoesterase [Deltaproteobacteria bacterium]|nr:TIGR00282 family metallophosphoesterase [Deltaproteobacteria bacterium]